VEDNTERGQGEEDMIWGPRGGQYEDGCLLGCSAVWTGITLPTFQRSVLPPSSGLQPRRQPSSRWRRHLSKKVNSSRCLKNHAVTHEAREGRAP
jgi:hypothetical protein